MSQRYTMSDVRRVMREAETSDPDFAMKYTRREKEGIARIALLIANVFESREEMMNFISSQRKEKATAATVGN